MFGVGRSTISDKPKNIFRNYTIIDKFLQSLWPNVSVLICKLFQSGVEHRKKNLNIFDTPVLASAFKYDIQFLVFRKSVLVIEHTCIDIHTETRSLQDICTRSLRLGKTLADNRGKYLLYLMLDIRRKQRQGKRTVLQSAQDIQHLAGVISLLSNFFPE